MTDLRRLRPTPMPSRRCSSPMRWSGARPISTSLRRGRRDRAPARRHALVPLDPPLAARVGAEVVTQRSSASRGSTPAPPARNERILATVAGRRHWTYAATYPTSLGVSLTLRLVDGVAGAPASRRRMVRARRRRDLAASRTGRRRSRQRPDRLRQERPRSTRCSRSCARRARPHHNRGPGGAPPGRGAPGAGRAPTWGPATRWFRDARNDLDVGDGLGLQKRRRRDRLLFQMGATRAPDALHRCTRRTARPRFAPHPRRRPREPADGGGHAPRASSRSAARRAVSYIACRALRRRP